jgi:hypothetical protein
VLSGLSNLSRSRFLRPVQIAVFGALACVVIVTGLGAASSVGLWLAVGGWGPPDAFVFTGRGFILGLVRANAISAGP